MTPQDEVAVPAVFTRALTEDEKVTTAQASVEEGRGPYAMRVSKRDYETHGYTGMLGMQVHSAEGCVGCSTQFRVQEAHDRCCV